MIFAMFDWQINVLVAVLFYLIGSIPSGYVVARLSGIKDIRQHGSGNIGATNVGRTLGPLYFVLVLFLDFIKAYGALYCVSVGGYPDIASQWALLLLLGNTNSIFLHGRGGKGVATSAGILAWCMPTVFYLFSASWIGITIATQTPWMASILSMLFLPFFTYCVVGFYHFNFFLLLMMIVVISRHTSNVKKFFFKV